MVSQTMPVTLSALATLATANGQPAKEEPM
jgi:hypothetical protein